MLWIANEDLEPVEIESKIFNLYQPFIFVDKSDEIKEEEKSKDKAVKTTRLNDDLDTILSPVRNTHIIIHRRLMKINPRNIY